MTINPLSANLLQLLPTNNAGALDTDKLKEIAEQDGSFANILSEALATVSQTDTADKASSLGLLMGQSDDLSGLMLDLQKAEISLNLALQIRNKIVDAYNEIMRMSV